MGFSRFLRLKVSIQEPERSKKEKKTGKKTVNILMHMKKLSRERVRCEAHQHLYPMVERAWLWQSVYHLSYLDQQVRAQVKSFNFKHRLVHVTTGGFFGITLTRFFILHVFIS